MGGGNREEWGFVCAIRKGNQQARMVSFHKLEVEGDVIPLKN
jgi:hypothetical protein